MMIRSLIPEHAWIFLKLTTDALTFLATPTSLSSVPVPQILSAHIDNKIVNPDLGKIDQSVLTYMP